jgi:hypothetical protein
VRGHLWLALLILDFLGGTKACSPIAPERAYEPGSTSIVNPFGSLDILILMVAAQKQPDPGVDHFVVPGRGIVIPE